MTQSGSQSRDAADAKVTGHLVIAGLTALGRGAVKVSRSPQVVDCLG
jgi:hypothetical protein